MPSHHPSPDSLAGLLQGRLRITVLGTPGAGKSTLARRLGQRLGLPCHHVDDLYWRPGWRPRRSAELVALVERLTATDQWIIEGNHLGTLPARMAAADGVVIVNCPWPVSLVRIARRSWDARRGHATLLPAPVRGEPEPWRSRLLVCRAAVRFQIRTLPAIERLLDEHLGAQVPVLRVGPARSGWRTDLPTASTEEHCLPGSRDVA